MKRFSTIILCFFILESFGQKDSIHADFVDEKDKSISLNILLPTIGIGLEYGIKKEKLSHHFYFNFYGSIVNTVNKLPLYVTDTSIHFRDTKNESINFEWQYGLYKNIKSNNKYFQLDIGLNFLVGSSNFNDSYSDYYHKYILNSNSNLIEYLDANNSSTNETNKIAKFHQSYGSQQSKYITFGMSAAFNPTFNLNNKYIGFNMILGANFLVHLKSKIDSDYSNQFQIKNENFFEDNSKIMLRFGRYF